MGNEDLTRRLSAILSMDVEGYSRLMREDEQAAPCSSRGYLSSLFCLRVRTAGRLTVLVRILNRDRFHKFLDNLTPDEVYYDLPHPFLEPF